MRNSWLDNLFSFGPISFIALLLLIGAYVTRIRLQATEISALLLSVSWLATFYSCFLGLANSFETVSADEKWLQRQHLFYLDGVLIPMILRQTLLSFPFLWFERLKLPRRELVLLISIVGAFGLDLVVLTAQTSSLIIWLE